MNATGMKNYFDFLVDESSRDHVTVQCSCFQGQRLSVDFCRCDFDAWKSSEEAMTRQDGFAHFIGPDDDDDCII